MSLNITLGDLRIRLMFGTLMSALWRLERVEVENEYGGILGRPGHLSVELLGLKTIIQ